MKVLSFQKLISALLSITILFSINSCCTAVYCLGADDLNEIRFYGFTHEEVDTIVIRKFNKNSNFKIALDSSTAYSIEVHSGTELKIVSIADHNKLSVDFDYKVELPGTGKTFTFSDFVSKKERCNSGFMCNDFYNSLESYKLNGQVTTSSGILEIHQ